MFPGLISSTFARGYGLCDNTMLCARGTGGCVRRVAVVSCELLSECKECVRTLGSAAFLELRDCDVKCASEHSAVASRSPLRPSARPRAHPRATLARAARLRAARRLVAPRARRWPAAGGQGWQGVVMRRMWRQGRGACGNAGRDGDELARLRHRSHGAPSSSPPSALPPPPAPPPPPLLLCTPPSPSAFRPQPWLGGSSVTSGGGGGGGEWGADA
jgi:hypothetical protein